MKPPTQREMAVAASGIAKELLALVGETAGCDNVALKFAIHAVGTVLMYELDGPEGTFKKHPEARASFEALLLETVKLLPKPMPHRCPECDEDAAEERKDRRGE